MPMTADRSSAEARLNAASVGRRISAGDYRRSCRDLVARPARMTVHDPARRIVVVGFIRDNLTEYAWSGRAQPPRPRRVRP